jgi:hypothetical protein
MDSIKQNLENKVFRSIEKLQLLGRLEMIFGILCFVLGAMILLLSGVLNINNDDLWSYILVSCLIGFISLLIGFDLKRTVRKFDTQDKVQLAVDGKIESLLLAPIVIGLVTGTVTVLATFGYIYIIVLVLLSIALFIIFLRDLIKLKTLTYKYKSELKRIKKEEKRQEKLLRQNAVQVDTNRTSPIKNVLSFLVVVGVIGIAITGIIFIGPLWIITILLALLVFGRR